MAIVPPFGTVDDVKNYQVQASAWGRSLVAVFVILGGGVSLSPAAAQESGEGDVLTAILGYSLTADSNLFRRPESAKPQSDVVSIASGSLRFDKSHSQQRFLLEATESLNRYRALSYLDFDATSYRGEWSWNIDPRLNIRISADRSRSLAPFEDTLGVLRNVSTRESRGVSLNGRLFGGWSWLSSISRSDQTSEQGIVNQPDQRTDGMEVGIKYALPSGDSLTVARRSSTGNYLNFSAAPGVTGSSFRQEETELKGIWKMSGKSELAWRLGEVERINEQIGQRNFSGMVGDLGYTWKPTAKLSFNITANQNKAPLQDPSFSYILTKGVTLAPIWQITEKVSLYMRLARTTSTDSGSGVIPAVGLARKDNLSRAEIGADWSPKRKIHIKASMERQQRSSTKALFGFEANIAKISALVTF